MKKVKKNIIEKKREAKEKEGQSYMKKLKIAELKNKYITNLVNGRYFLARCNMIAEQLISKKVKEKIDGLTKSLEYIRAEYALTKVQAIKSMREVHFTKEELVKDFEFKDKDFEAIEIDYYDGNIMRESYDESYKKEGKAKFTNT